jgi:DNA-binding CsgD family transcriptional regulator
MSMGISPGEGQWLDVIADILTTSLPEIPDQPIAHQLIRSFDVRCGSSSKANGQVACRLPTLASNPLGPLVDNPPLCLRDVPTFSRHVATGVMAEVHVLERPKDVRQQRQYPHREVTCRRSGDWHHIYLPLLALSGTARTFVVSRPSEFTWQEIELARAVQRMLVGLQSQAARLGGAGEAGASATIRLTPREAAVLKLVAEGITAAAVGHCLNIAERTVHKHLERIYAKFGVCDRVSAVLAAHRYGLLGAAPAEMEPVGSARR